LQTDYIVAVVEMITVTVFYRITWKTILSRGGSYIEAVPTRNVKSEWLGGGILTWIIFPHSYGENR